MRLREPPQPPENRQGQVSGSGSDDRANGATTPSVPTVWAITAILIPVALMLLSTIAEILLPKGSPVLSATTMVGEPVVAMLIGFGFALFAFALARVVPARQYGDPCPTVSSRWSGSC